MTPVIRVDDEVMARLQSHAVEWGFVFGTPNQTLRRLLGLDDNQDQHQAVAPPIDMSEGRTPCECGCGDYPKSPRSRYLPGHDAKHLSKLIKELRERSRQEHEEARAEDEERSAEA